MLYYNFHDWKQYNSLELSKMETLRPGHPGLVRDRRGDRAHGLQDGGGGNLEPVADHQRMSSRYSGNCSMGTDLM